MREICSYRFLPEKEPRLCRAKVELEPSSLVEGAYQLKKLQWTGDSVVIGGGDAPPLLHTGYFDSHLHTFWLGDTSKRVLGSEFESAEAYLKACAQRLDPFCLSYSFDEERWGVSLGDFQKKAEEILGNEYPWLLYRVCGHRALLGGPWVSRLFPGQNEVRSIFLDDHTLNLLEEISELDQDELKEDFLVAQDCLLSQGVTAVGDMSLEASMVRALHDLVAENKTMLRLPRRAD
jgi:predicted amidohydrolase YtcJ